MKSKYELNVRIVSEKDSPLTSELVLVSRTSVQLIPMISQAVLKLWKKKGEYYDESYDTMNNDLNK